MEVAIAHCKKWLATVWFVGAGSIFFIVLVQSLLGRYGEQANEAWGWLLPTVMPTLSLIIGVLVFDAVQKEKKPKTIDRFLFRLTVSLSSAYLAAVFLVIALQPLADVPPLQMMTQANVWLGPFQGLVAAAMGAFFVKAARSDSLARSSDSKQAGAAAQ